MVFSGALTISHNVGQPAGFLHVQGREIVDGNGQPVHLRGVNMHTYYYSYLWDANAPWDYATQADVQYLATLGVTAIRLGFHWRYFDTSLGFDLLDAYLDWCEQAGIYVILDMHVAPPEDDILEGKIWDDPAAQQQFLDLWTAIAARYADRTIVAGYDIYNEPAPPDAAQWWDLADRARAAIRAVDANHILFVENPLIEDGAFQLIADPNAAYSFHDYSPLVVSHAAADWVGDSPVPADYVYPGTVLMDTAWAASSDDAAEFTGQSSDWRYWDSGELTVPSDVAFATLSLFSWGDIGAVWFDDLELDHNGVSQTVFNADLEEGSSLWEGMPANWYFWSDSDFTGAWSDEQAHSGAHSLKITGDGDGYGVWTQDNWILTSPLVPVQAGDSLRVRGRILAPQNNGGVGLGIDYLNGVYEHYDRTRLQADLQPYLDWAAANNVPLFVGEFGVMSTAPGDSRYNLVSDMIGLMNEAGLHWTLWAYREPSFGLYLGDELDQRLAEVLRQGLNNDVSRQYLPLALRTAGAHVYLPDSSDTPNPERGFFNEVDFAEQDLTWYAEGSGNTLARLPVRLDDYRNSDLPQGFLDDLDAYFDLARAAGLKLIVRFSYNNGPYPNPEPDAPLAQVLRHIEQVAPILEANQDALAFIEAGFIGAWGEWHSSTNGLDTPENKAIIRDALFAHFPPERPILFRDPEDFIGWYPQPLDASQAFTTTLEQARLGHHNDCFLASEDDEGTYWSDAEDRLMRAEWQAYIAQMTRFVPMSGETCAVNPPRSDCPTALNELEMLHWNSMNEGWYPDVVQSWVEQGCYEEIRQRLGYRLVLREATFAQQVQAGDRLQVTVSLENTGFAAPMLPRPVYLVVASQDITIPYPVNVDWRRWEPGAHTFTATLDLPSQLSPGQYQLALWLPDSSAALRADPHYAVRCSNQGVWDAVRGWNVLGELTARP